MNFKLKNNTNHAERTEVIIMKSLAQLGLFAGGVLFGTAGIKILSSKDAKKAYTQTTAAVLTTSWQIQRRSMKSVPQLKK